MGSRNVLISKAQAVQITGSEKRLLNLVRQVRKSRTEGELWRLFNGAGLYFRYRGAAVRYSIFGYRSDGSDVAEVLTALAAGDRCLGSGDKRIRGVPEEASV